MLKTRRVVSNNELKRIFLKKYINQHFHFKDLRGKLIRDAVHFYIKKLYSKTNDFAQLFSRLPCMKSVLQWDLPGIRFIIDEYLD